VPRAELLLREEGRQLFDQISWLLFGDPVATVLDHATANVVGELAHREQCRLPKTAVAAERQYRHRELGLRVFLVVIDVRANRAIVFEARPQPAGR
jgi:hypothetical protein